MPGAIKPSAAAVVLAADPVPVVQTKETPMSTVSSHRADWMSRGSVQWHGLMPVDSTFCGPDLPDQHYDDATLMALLRAETTEARRRLDQKAAGFSCTGTCTAAL